MFKGSGNEGLEHITFKKVAVDILKEKGFNPEEIKNEYPVSLKVNGHIRYIVDVAGLKEDYKIAVECGNTDLSKIVDLRKLFDEVIVVDAVKVVELYDSYKTAYYRDTKMLRLENENLRKQIDSVKRSNNENIRIAESHVQKVEEENRSLKHKLRTIQNVLGKQKVWAELWEKEQGEKKEPS